DGPLRKGRRPDHAEGEPVQHPALPRRPEARDRMVRGPRIGHLGPRPGARDQDAPHLRPGRRRLAGLVRGRIPRLLREPAGGPPEGSRMHEGPPEGWGGAPLVYDPPGGVWPADVPGEGRWVGFIGALFASRPSTDLYVLPLAGAKTPLPVVTGPAVEIDLA